MRSKKSAFVMLVLTTSMGLAFLYAFESATPFVRTEARESHMPSRVIPRSNSAKPTAACKKTPYLRLPVLRTLTGVTYDPVDNR